MKTPDQILKLAEYFLAVADAAYELQQEYLESNPAELDKFLDYNRDRSRQWREKNYELWKTRKIEYDKMEAIRKRELMKSGNLDGLLLLLGTQVASKKKDIKNKRNPQMLQDFEEIAKRINDFRFYVKEYLYGIHHSNPAYVAKPEQLYNLIEQGKLMRPLAMQASPTILKSFDHIIIKLQEMADAFTMSN